ncbi:MAG: cyanoexosortase A [Microcoleaceae cyanobacterium MO_207.B10]|nr:cyanoexosortase A [Microcoleaceae cyanobacterium MO_207.B10]
MKATQIAPDKLIKNLLFWLLAITSGLVTIYITALWKSDDSAHLGMSALFFLAIGSMIWERRYKLNLESETIPTILGLLIIGGLLFNSTNFAKPDTVSPFWRLYPFIAGVSLSLIASGFQGFKQFWRELTILFFIGGPSVIISSLMDISEITAKFSTFLLWYMGFDVVNEGVYVLLPTGSVRVFGGCSGLESITYVLGLAVMCMLMFPTTKKVHKYIVPIVGLIIGFVVNGFRVALMAILVAYSQPEAFDYWHEGDGSLIFGMIAVMVFGLFYMFLMKQDENQHQEPENL